MQVVCIRTLLMIFLRLLIELSEMFASGSIRQPDLVQEFDVADLELAISQFMSESRIGKIVLLYDQPQTILKAS